MQKNTHSERLRFAWLTTLILLVMLSVMGSPVLAEDENAHPIVANKIVNPGTDLWRDVRQRDGAVAGITQMKGTDAGVLVNVEGQEWRQFRANSIIPNSAMVLGLLLLILIAFRLIRGEMKITEGRSGKKILRFTYNQRAVHWFVAILFVILGISGLTILLGRTTLLPIFGSAAFGSLAYVSKLAHNYLGPLFSIGLILMLFTFIKGNFFNGKDMGWFMKGGGMLGGHASAGRYNAGEKSWFWLVILCGGVVVVSGLVLNFPIFDQTRETMSFYTMVHGIASVVIVAASFGHIYMGTVGSEGALETMTTGYCDANWAKEHHDEWYEEVKDQQVDASELADEGGKHASEAPAQPRTS